MEERKIEAVSTAGARTLLEEQEHKEGLREQLAQKEYTDDHASIVDSIFGDSEESDEEPELVSSIELEIRGGKRVCMAYPERSLQLLLAKIFANSTPTDTGRMYAKAMCYITSISGEPVRTPTSRADLIRIAQELGDRGLDEVFIAYQKYFAATPDQLRVVKKNLLE